MPTPTFLVIGAGRSGTTSLHHHLRNHPQVFVPEVKAPSYFYAEIERDVGSTRRRETKGHFVRNFDDYKSLFNGSEWATARGEVSPAYLASPMVPGQIRKHLGEIKVIAIIRNPTDRFIARFIARQRDGLERASSITEVVNKERAAGINLDDTAGTYLASGHVCRVLERYEETFGRDSLNLHLYEDLVGDAPTMLKSIFAAIGVDVNVEFNSQIRRNESGRIASPITRSMWRHSAQIRQVVRPLIPAEIRDRAFRRVTRRMDRVSIPAADRKQLNEYYADEVATLAKFLGRDLSHWTSN